MDNGVTIHITNNDEIEIFSNNTNSDTMKIIKNSVVSEDMKLYKDGTKVVFAKGNKLYNLKMKN